MATSSTMATFYFKRVVFLLFFSFSWEAQNLCANADADPNPTYGFTRVQLTNQERKLQTPYNKAPADRYSKVNGVERFWVYTNDKPLKQGSPTRPRSEIRILGHDYTSGVWQFEGNFYVPQGTTGLIIMQVFGAETEATTLQLRVDDGNLMYYERAVVASNIYDKWFQLNVVHDADAGHVTIFINGSQKLVVNGHGRSTFYFKYGAYAAKAGSSNYMESRWKGIKIFKKSY